jgi:hypothetical protein
MTRNPGTVHCKEGGGVGRYAEMQLNAGSVFGCTSSM